jgi:hypothetical protein
LCTRVHLDVKFHFIYFLPLNPIVEYIVAVSGSRRTQSDVTKTVNTRVATLIPKLFTSKRYNALSRICAVFIDPLNCKYMNNISSVCHVRRTESMCPMCDVISVFLIYLDRLDDGARNSLCYYSFLCRHMRHLQYTHDCVFFFFLLRLAPIFV